MDDARPKKVRGNLLIVDDDLTARQTLDALMTQEEYEVRCAPNGETALIFAREDPPELILLDVRLPDMDGFQVCRRLKEDRRSRNIPVIFISALDEVVDKVKGFDAGGVDYITKPFQVGEMLARVEAHLSLKRLQEQIETKNAQLEQEIAKSKRAEEKIIQAAQEWRTTFDSITDLVSIHDKDFTIVKVNRAFAVVVGMEIEEVLGKKCYEVIHGTGEPWPKCPHHQTVESGMAVTEEFLEPRLGKYLQVSASPIFNDQKEVVGSVHIAKDITERKGAEEALQRAHDELEERVRIRTADLAIANEELVVSEKALEERLQFEQLLSDLSARFVIIPPDRVDSEIEAALKQLLDFFKVDRCALLRTLPGKTSWLITHVANVENIPPVPVRIELPRSIHPWAYDKLTQRREVVCFSRLEDVPAEADVDKKTWIEWGIRSNLVIPILTEESIDYVITFNSLKSERVWPEEFVPRLRLLGEIFVNALERRQNSLLLEKQLREIENLKQRLERENIYLQDEIKLLAEHTEIVGQSPAMNNVLAQAAQVAPTDSTVLLLGETGTGKELLARAIHSMSSRKDRPLVTVNCASLPPTLIESELFGRERGAYTGALTKMVGRFEVADGSTLFLDEIGELPHELQSKLLRVLEEGNFERLGSTKTLHVNVRIIAATNRDIAQDVNGGKFRKDLYYRLNVFPIVIPPLRERPEDIPLMTWSFVREFQKKMGKRIDSIPRKSMEALQAYSWPGNVRELRNVIERAIIISSGRVLNVPVPSILVTETPGDRNLDEVERRHILSVLERTAWRLTGKGGAAETLGLKRTTLQSKMKKLGIKRPATKSDEI
jgi:formate hydrogenlyase transcriptional activator